MRARLYRNVTRALDESEVRIECKVIVVKVILDNVVTAATLLD